MRAFAGFLGALAGLLVVGLGAYFLLVRKPAAVSVQAQRPPGAASASSDPSAIPHPDKAVAAPLSREDQLKEELGRKRLPFFRFLRLNYSDLIERFSVLEDYDTLDLVVTKSDDATVARIIQIAIAPSAKEYGFRRVRFYTRNAPTSVEPFTVVAESSDDGSGHWNTFRK